MTPDFSPVMLKLFLRARVTHAAMGLNGLFEGGARLDAIRAEKARLRKAAGVTNFEFNAAFMGRLMRAAPRLRLWGACDVAPGDYGAVLTDHGGQSMASCDVPGAGGGSGGRGAEGDRNPAAGRKGKRPSRTVSRPAGAPAGEAGDAAREARQARTQI